MVFNDVKFELLRYGNNEDVKRNTTYNSSNENVIEEHQSVKDLGVTMSNNCKFNDHINATIINARKLSTWIFRTFKTRAPSPMLTLWKSLVLPKLEYCSQLWNPWLKGNKMNLEMVQWSFIRKIKDSTRSYWERLKKYKIFSLERRRERYIIIYIWKVLENLVPNISEIDGIRAEMQPRLGRLCFIKARNTRAPAGLQTIRHNYITTMEPQ